MQLLIFLKESKLKFTFKKNKLPTGRITRCVDALSGVSSLYQTTLGSGIPSALQLMVTGSFLGTVVSIGCSTIRGAWKAKKRIKKKRNQLMFSNPRCFAKKNLVLNLIKLKVLFLLSSIFLVHSFSHPHNQIMDFRLRRLPNQQNTKRH